MATTAPATRTRQHKRPIERDPIREEARTPIRTSGRVEAIGRDGKPVSRKRPGGGADQFYIPGHIIPEGWSYEWKRATVFGQVDRAHQIHLGENGWTPVPASRHDGMFMPPGDKGAIERDGLVLMERPVVLTEEAREEDRQAARNLIIGQADEFDMKLPRGFDQGHGKAARQQKKSYHESPAELRPKLELADDE